MSQTPNEAWLGYLINALKSDTFVIGGYSVIVRPAELHVSTFITALWESASRSITELPSLLTS